MAAPPELFPVTSEYDGLTVAAVLRALLPDRSWSQVRQLVSARRFRRPRRL